MSILRKILIVSDLSFPRFCKGALFLSSVPNVKIGKDSK
jgi:hypothetical protein